jgi:hypothetical protein
MTYFNKPSGKRQQAATKRQLPLDRNQAASGKSPYRGDCRFPHFLSSQYDILYSSAFSQATELHINYIISVGVMPCLAIYFNVPTPSIG